jgi:erythromycin esterase-like protein
MATNSETKPTTPERREYKRNWMRNFRAQKKQANDSGSNPGTDDDGSDFLLKYPESQQAFIESRVEVLERQLYDAKHPDLQYQHNISYTPEVIPISQQVTDEFSAKIDELEQMDGPIGPRQAKARELEKERERIGKQLTYENTQTFGKRLVVVRDKLRGLDQRAEYFEKMIVLWSPGGTLRRDREAQIEQDRAKGETQRNSRDPYEQRQGIAILNACDKNEGEIEVTLGRMKAELKTLRG